jgi:hypothetical protein
MPSVISEKVTDSTLISISKLCILAVGENPLCPDRWLRVFTSSQELPSLAGDLSCWFYNFHC